MNKITTILKDISISEDNNNNLTIKENVFLFNIIPEYLLNKIVFDLIDYLDKFSLHNLFLSSFFKNLLNNKYYNDNIKLKNYIIKKYINKVGQFNNKKYKLLKGHTSSVNSVGFNHDGTKIVSGSRDKTICVWNVDKESDNYGECILTLKGHTSYVLSDTTKCIQIYTSSKIKNIHININI